jgi:PAS domain S-box-containing protein
MEIKWTDRLSFRQAKQTVTVAIIIGILLSTFQIASDLFNENKQMDSTITQIVGMLIGSAENATYNVDSILARNIVHGLLKYDPVCKAELTDESRRILASAERVTTETLIDRILAPVLEKYKHYEFPLFHEKIRQTGTLQLTVDRYRMAGNFVGRSMIILVSGMVRNIVLATILALIFYNTLTQPLLRIVARLTRIDPENPRQGKIGTIPGHDHDEMGLLVSTFDALMAGFDESLAQRSAAERQITEQKDLIRGIMNSVPDGILTINEAGDIEDCNPAALALFGCERHLIVGTSVNRLFENFDDSPLKKRIEASFHPADTANDASDPEKNPETDLNPIEATAKCCRQGKTIPVETRLGMLALQERKIAVCIVNDITRRKESENALRESEQRYRILSENLEADVTRKTIEIQETQSQMMHQEKMASIGHLAAGVAHEINNPMGFITSNLKTLSQYTTDLGEAIDSYSRFIDGVRDDERLAPRLGTLQNDIENLDLEYLLGDIPSLLKESLDGAERINQIVSDLKNFAHPGKEDPKYADLVQCIESTMNIIRNELKYKATVVRSFTETPRIYCYPRQLNQAIMNLLVNAAQAIETTGTIEISTRDLGGHVELSIRDTGQGIPEANLTKIFDPFFTTKEVGKGTGLGLNMVYTIIKKHQGTISVESTVGKGTVFTIKLPVNPDLQS